MIQNRLEKQPFTLHNPPNSEVNENILSLCASSPIARNSLEEALERNSNGAFRPLSYSDLTQKFKLTDLVSWVSVSNNASIVFFHKSNFTLLYSSGQRYPEKFINVAIVPSLPWRSYV